MSKSKNTKPELSIRRELYSWGFRYRIHSKDLPGTPDIVFPQQRIAIFINGCFWHQHGNCVIGDKVLRLNYDRRSKMIISGQRDLRVLEDLVILGWKSLVIWECDINLDSRFEAEKIAIAVSNSKRVAITQENKLLVI